LLTQADPLIKILDIIMQPETQQNYGYVDVITEIQNFQNCELFFLSKFHIRLQYQRFLVGHFITDTIRDIKG
jgi:hypothetical protein